MVDMSDWWSVWLMGRLNGSDDGFLVTLHLLDGDGYHGLSHLLDGIKLADVVLQLCQSAIKRIVVHLVEVVAVAGDSLEGEHLLPDELLALLGILEPLAKMGLDPPTARRASEYDAKRLAVSAEDIRRVTHRPVKVVIVDYMVDAKGHEALVSESI